MLPEDRDAFTDFMKILRNSIPYGKLVTVCVAANPEDSKIGWHGSYDYAALGEIASYVFIMTYDEHVQGSPVGTVASIPFVEKAINNALLYIPREKLVMGIPLYGRYWNLDTGTGGRPVVIGAIKNIMDATGAKEEFNEIYMEPSLTFEVNNEVLPIRINGVDLEDGKYIAWYENEQSIYAKMQIVNKYQLLGAGVWALGQENIDVWEYFYPYRNEVELDLTDYYRRIEEENKAIEEQQNAELEEEQRLISRREKYMAIQVKIEEAKEQLSEKDLTIDSNIENAKDSLNKIVKKNKIYKMLPHIEQEKFELEHFNEKKHKKKLEIKKFHYNNVKFIGKKYKKKTT